MIVFSFASFCPNCYCYVCDVPVAECTGPWPRHCEAAHEDPAWRRAREACRTSGEGHVASRGGEEADASGAVAKLSPPATCVPISCEALLGAVQQVLEYPPRTLANPIARRPNISESHRETPGH